MALSESPKEAPPRPLAHLRLWYWGAVTILLTLVVLLALAVKGDSVPSQDRTVLDWVSALDFPGLAGFFNSISFLTDNWPAMVLGVAGVVFLLSLGMTREALGFAVVGGIVGIVAFLGDFALGIAVGRSRPLAEASGYSFPSGHVFGSTVFFGFSMFLAAHYQAKKKFLAPLLGLLTLAILSTGASRIYLQAHWPSDVAAGYLLGMLWLLILIPLYQRLQSVGSVSKGKLQEDLAVLSCETCRAERSIASVVLLDPQQGKATKVYRPPPLVRLLYWLSYQARFPYESNMAALQAAVYRRQIASLLTLHRFGKDLVAHVSGVNCIHGKCSFVTDFVPGDKVPNDVQARRFLAQVSETFADAGLSVWQVNPRNPHAHTNLIRTPEGDFKIIDLESAIVTLLPARGHWRSALRRGAIPVFDDIDFERLKGYVAAHAVDLEGGLGPEGVTRLDEAVVLCERAIRSWKDAEPHVWGRLTGRVYRLLDWKASLQHLRHALDGASAASSVFLDRGITRWEAEGRLAPEEQAQLRSLLASAQISHTLRHLGAHLVLGAVVVPIPGLRSAARFAWTLGFWTKGHQSRWRRGSGSVTNIHTPLVMFIALVPVLGGVAYLAAPPMRHRLLVRFMLDQVAYKLPFRLYHHLHLAKLLVPTGPHSTGGSSDKEARLEPRLRSEHAQKK